MSSTDTMLYDLDPSNHHGRLATNVLDPEERKAAATEVQERLDSTVAKFQEAEDRYDSTPTVENMERLIEAREKVRHVVREGRAFMEERGHDA